MNSRRIKPIPEIHGGRHAFTCTWKERSFALLSTAVMLMMTFSSCARKSSGSDGPDQPLARSYITISAQLNIPQVPQRSGLRATDSEGSWKPINGTPDQPILTPDGVGNANEYRVNSIRILLFDNIKGGERYIPQGNRLIYKTSEGTLPQGNAVTPDALHSNLSKSFTFPPILVPKGSYRIVLVANASNNMAARLDDPSNSHYVRNIRDLESFVFDLYDYVQDRAFNSSELEVLADIGYGFPMVGELTVALANGGGTSHQPEQIGTIRIKRAVSYIRMIVTNKDVHGHQFPGTEEWEVYQMGLVNGGRNSRLLERVATPLDPSLLTYYKRGNVPREFLDYTTWGQHGPNGIGSFQNNLPDQFNYEVYACEKLGITSSSDYLYFKIVMKNSTTDDTKTYMVPIFSESNGVRDYNVYRNTLYTVTAYFKGGELKTSVKAVPWGGETINAGDFTSDDYQNE